MSASGRGFTLLEVLVAIAILGLGLTTILSAQTGLFASATRVEKLSGATALVRCRMNEIEVEMLEEGFPLVDTDDDGICCDDDERRDYRCTWKVQRVILPQPPGMESLESGDDALGQGSMGPLGALATIGQTNGAALGPDADLGGLADLMGGSAVGGTQAMAPLVMGLVYPQLKPMLEASIRKVVVTVHWTEGSVERDLSVIQFLTNPQQGGFDPLAAQGVEGMDAAPAGAQGALQDMLGGLTGAAGSGQQGSGRPR